MFGFHHLSPQAMFATEFSMRHPVTQPWQCDSQQTCNTTGLKCMCQIAMEISKVPRLARKSQIYLWKIRNIVSVTQNGCWTPHKTCWNVTNRHACHTKHGYATFDTSKKKLLWQHPQAGTDSSYRVHCSVFWDSGHATWNRCREEVWMFHRSFSRSRMSIVPTTTGRQFTGRRLTF